MNKTHKVGNKEVKKMESYIYLPYKNLINNIVPTNDSMFSFEITTSHKEDKIQLNTSYRFGLYKLANGRCGFLLYTTHDKKIKTVPTEMEDHNFLSSLLNDKKVANFLKTEFQFLKQQFVSEVENIINSTHSFPLPLDLNALKNGNDEIEFLSNLLPICSVANSISNSNELEYIIGFTEAIIQFENWITNRY